MRLRAAAPGVRVATATRWATTTTVIEATGACLVVDPALTTAELAAVSDEVAGLRVVVGFSTHPHWDHLLWHPGLGTAPRYALPDAVAHVARERATLLAEARAELGSVDEDLFAQVIALEGEAVGGDAWTGVTLPWDGPRAVVVPYRGHAVGSGALVVAGVMVAGDVLSDREVPLLDPAEADPVGAYLGGLDVLAAAWRDLAPSVLIPGHGTVTDAAGFTTRLAADRAYLTALAGGRDVVDPRLADPEVARDHAAQVALLARRGGRPRATRG